MNIYWNYQYMQKKILVLLGQIFFCLIKIQLCCNFILFYDEEKNIHPVNAITQNVEDSELSFFV